MNYMRIVHYLPRFTYVHIARIGKGATRERIAGENYARELADNETRRAGTRVII